MSRNLNLVDRIGETHARIRPRVRETYLQYSPVYSQRTGANVYFKCENLQHTGSFKLRGAMSKFLSLSEQDKQLGLVAASTGNHGKAVAYTAQKFDTKAKVFVPENSQLAKTRAIRQLGAEVVLSGMDCIESELAAREFAENTGAVYVSPYNDPMVVAGQGTIGVELCQQLNHIDMIFASLGGGGLISGIATHLKTQMPNCQIIGCSPFNSKVMIDSLAAGKLLDLPSSETLSDGTAGGVEAGSITFELCQQLIDQCITVTESEIRDALLDFVGSQSMLIEGAAAVAIASLEKSTEKLAGKNVVVILCGANIGITKLRQVIQSPASV